MLVTFEEFLPDTVQSDGPRAPNADTLLRLIDELPEQWKSKFTTSAEVTVGPRVLADTAMTNMWIEILSLVRMYPPQNVQITINECRDYMLRALLLRVTINITTTERVVISQPSLVNGQAQETYSYLEIPLRTETAKPKVAGPPRTAVPGAVPTRRLNLRGR